MADASFKNNGCTKLLLLTDVSRHYFQFSLPDGNIKFKTLSGSLVTIILGALVFCFAVSQFVILWGRSDYHIIDKK